MHWWERRDSAMGQGGREFPFDGPTVWRLFGAPYFPSLKKPIQAGLDMLDLKPGQVLYDLGCGDGRILKVAAGRGIKCVGYELNPFMFLYSWATTRRCRPTPPLTRGVRRDFRWL